MKTAKTAIGAWIILILAGYGTFTTIRIHKLEARLSEANRRVHVGPITYTFDHSFLSYFGPRGVEEIERELKIRAAMPAGIRNEFENKPGLKYEVH